METRALKYFSANFELQTMVARRAYPLPNLRSNSAYEIGLVSGFSPDVPVVVYLVVPAEALLEVPHRC